MTGEHALNLKEAAARLGVHYMTAYRYVRQGRLDADLVGTEWRVAPASVDAFLAARGEAAPRDERKDGPQPRAGGAGPRRADWSGRLERCLLAADEPAAWQVLEAALASGHSPTACYLEVIGRALASIGARWETGELGVADQHVATAVATRLVAHLGARFRRPGRSRGSVVFGAPTGELHSLPVAIAADVVRLAGFDVLELGANVPPEAFAAAAQRASRLVAVGIGITAADRLPAVRATLCALAALVPPPPVVVGGSGAACAEAASLEGVHGYAADGYDAVALVDALARRRPRR